MRKATKIAVTVTAGAAIIATAAACSSSGPSKKAVVSVPSGLKGTTSVALDSGFLGDLKALKLTPGTTGTAKLDASTGVVSFPITGGHVTVYNKGAVTPYVQGELDHDGSGLSLSAGGKTVTLENFVVDPGNNSNLKGEVLLNGAVAVKSTTLFDLDGSTLKTPTLSNGVATLTGTRVLVDAGAAALLDKTFGTTAVKGGLLVGIATIKAS